jgi:hypothetical protein
LFLFFIITFNNFKCNNNKKNYPYSYQKLSFFQKIKNKIYFFIKRKSYTNQVYQLIYSFLRKPRNIHQYPPLPSSIMKDLMATQQLINGPLSI